MFLSNWRSAVLTVLVLTASAQKSQIPLDVQGHCRTIEVHSGDSCGSLAKRCDISGHDFEKYNPGPHLCSTLQPLQHVCCSPGGLPDLKPKPNPDGSCHTYTAKHGDYCAAIAAAHDLTVSIINDMNRNTWGWEGCANLQAGQTFCLSRGTPPMPSPVEGAVCGPQVNGTKPPKDMSHLAELNPCPLNACCDKWGQCGTTAEFCTRTDSSTGAPGTSAPHTNGCISNCGTDIVNNDEAPARSRSIGYFEAWNEDRPCLNMDSSQIDAAEYDIVHFAFAEITQDFNVKIVNKKQFEIFKKQKGFQKVLSFGGWGFSTGDTYPIFREAVTDANRLVFAKNVAAFVKVHELDGADFDWEYPNAKDLPGVPAGDGHDGKRYLGFLSAIRSVMPRGKSLSIAAPASYWYLKGFPIADISKVVDYIVYMTYDLHGQWDYKNEFAADGCPHGSCLRSHVNYTETINALSMITKAGVPASKIIVGLGSYGRSFQMTDPDCGGPECTFTGPKSGARPGICTETAGYISNAEIQDIIAKDKTAATHYDQGSDSIILRYGDKNWVAFMDDNTRKSRISSYKAKNFGGVVEWAMDLKQFHPPTEGHQGGHGPDLYANCSCQDVENFQGPSGLTSSMWNFAHASEFFSDWIQKKWHPGPNHFFMSEFADPWGMGQSTSSCRITGNCPRPDCSWLDDPNEKGSGPAYMVVTSFVNVATVLQNIYSAAGSARAKWNSLPDWFQTHFNTNEGVGDYNATPLKELILGLGTAIGTLAALTGNPEIGAVGAFAGGLAGMIVTAIPTPAEDAVKELAQFEKFMDKTLTQTEDALSATFDDLMNNGHHSAADPSSSDLKLSELFQDGTYLDWKAIPVLNSKKISNTQLDGIFQKHTSAAAINWAWHTQRVWLMSYPMTEDEFNHHYAYSGNNDSRLKHYYKGRGYFFLSIFPQVDPPSEAYDPRIQDPPGWGNIEEVGITTWQVIESSADGYALGGYEYDPTRNLAETLRTTTRDLLTDSVSLPGVFSIPICDLDSSYGWTPTVERFFHALAGPGAIEENNDHGFHAPLCYCLKHEDRFGKKFQDQIGLKQFEGYPWCPIGEFNRPGGPPSSTPTITTEPPPDIPHTVLAKDEL